MRVIFTGTRTFGATVLEDVLIGRHDVAAVWAQDPEDKVARVARSYGLRVVYGREDAREVEQREADLFVAAHSHAFLSRPARQATRLGAIGYHPSLLPRHRGRDAVEWTVRMGDPIAGGSVYWFTDNVDGGPVAAQDWCHVVPGWTASDLWGQELFPMGVRLTREVLDELDRGIIREVPQDERCATWEPSIDRPPLFRPELPQIGERAGYTTVVTRA